ncbi:MAG: hypothetical protein MPJ27_07585 [Pirellulales bacterium]|nr:hypothetical protein [Pirellulales bacterium]
MNTHVANPLALTSKSDSFTATAITLTTDPGFTKPSKMAMSISPKI